MKFKDFIALPLNRKAEELRIKGTLLDADKEDQDYVNLYYYSGFFVEEFIDAETNVLSNILPYRSGFKVSHYLKGKHSLIGKGNMPLAHSSTFSLN